MDRKICVSVGENFYYEKLTHEEREYIIKMNSYPITTQKRIKEFINGQARCFTTHGT